MTTIAELSATDLRERFPEFAAATFSDAHLSQALRTAKEISSVSSEATLYCAAHILTLRADEAAKQDGGSGIVAQERIGPKWTMYRTQARQERDVFFATSSYGRMVLTLESRNPKRVLSAFFG